MFVSFNSNMKGTYSGAGIAYHSGALDFIPVFKCSIISFLYSVLSTIVCLVVLFLLSGYNFYTTSIIYSIVYIFYIAKSVHVLNKVEIRRFFF
jgi:hypothetical protein